MGRYTVLDTQAFKKIQLGAGVLLWTYDINNPYELPENSAIIATTSGGVNPSCVPTYSDFAEDVDNAQPGLKEFMRLDSWECKLSFDTITFNDSVTQLSLGAADVTVLSNGVRKIQPRRDLLQTDFRDIWWAGDIMDEGGAAVIHVKNVLSSGGFSVQTEKDAKGKLTIELTAHPSLATQNEIPMEYYIVPPVAAATSMRIEYRLTGATSTSTAESVDFGGVYTTTIAASAGYTIDSSSTVNVTMGGIDITAMAYESSSGAINIDAVTADVTITVIATETETP